jgi:hypothetical protein
MKKLLSIIIIIFVCAFANNSLPEKIIITPQKYVGKKINFPLLYLSGKVHKYNNGIYLSIDTPRGSHLYIPFEWKLSFEVNENIALQIVKNITDKNGHEVSINGTVKKVLTKIGTYYTVEVTDINFLSVSGKILKTIKG